MIIDCSLWMKLKKIGVSPIVYAEPDRLVSANRVCPFSGAVPQPPAISLVEYVDPNGYFWYISYVVLLRADTVGSSASGHSQSPASMRDVEDCFFCRWLVDVPSV